MRLLLTSAALALLTACPLPTSAPSNPSVLRAYQVPANSGAKLREVLTGLMRTSSGSKDTPPEYLGRVEVGPDGRLLVLAPEAVQRGVAEVLASVGSGAFPQPASVRVDYWVISATHGQGERPASLTEVGAALSEIEKTDGPMQFQLVERLSLISLANEHGSLDGREVKVRQSVQVADGQLLAQVSMERFGQRVDTLLRMKPGAVAVLSAAGMRMEEKSDTSRSVYFLVRATNDEGR